MFVNLRRLETERCLGVTECVCVIDTLLLQWHTNGPFKTPRYHFAQCSCPLASFDVKLSFRILEECFPHPTCSLIRTGLHSFLFRISSI